MPYRRTTERIAHAFYGAAGRLVGVRKACMSVLDATIESLEAASNGIRDMDTGHTDEWVACRREETGVWCTLCEDTGISSGGWCDGSPCHCSMGVLREEAEKVGLIIPSAELIKRRESSV